MGFDDLDDALDEGDEPEEPGGGSVGGDSRDSQTTESDEKGGSVSESGRVDRSELPLVLRRKINDESVKDGRGHVDLFVLPETETRESEALDELDERFGDDLSKIDAREAIYRAGLRNLDDVSGELSGWGYE